MYWYAGDTCFIPIAISVRDLRELVVKRLTDKYPAWLGATHIKIPSACWISYQFSPKHLSHDGSMQYTGALNIKHKVQARTLRAHHPDSHYVACWFKMTKRLGVVAAQIIEKYTQEDEEEEAVVFYSMDDKAQVSVGEPHLAVSFGGRGRRNILPTDVTAVACDRDFKIVSLTPSVTLRVDVKLNDGEDCTSYYRGAQERFLDVFMLLVTCYVFTILWYFVMNFNIGEANVTIQDSIFQKSGLIRHVAELLTMNEKMG